MENNDKLTVSYSTRDEWDDFDDAVRKIIEIEKPQGRTNCNELETVLKSRLIKEIDMYYYDWRKKNESI